MTHRLEFARVFLCELVDKGGDHAARTTPGCPEVHKNRNVALQYLSFEGCVSHHRCGTYTKKFGRDTAAE
jgi:hypothetical protein